MWKAGKEMLPQIYYGLEIETQEKHCGHFLLPERQSVICKKK